MSVVWSGTACLQHQTCTHTTQHGVSVACHNILMCRYQGTGVPQNFLMGANVLNLLKRENTSIHYTVNFTNTSQFLSWSWHFHKNMYTIPLLVLLIFSLVTKRPTDRPTNQPTNKQTKKKQTNKQIDRQTSNQLHNAGLPWRINIHSVKEFSTFCRHQNFITKALNLIIILIQFTSSL
jgi:hypothetical protein